MADIKTEIQNLIDAKLPALEANRLREYIEQAEKDKEELAKLKQQQASWQADAQKERTRRESAESVTRQTQAKLDEALAREAAVANAERDVLVAGMKQDKAEAQLATAIEVVGLFTRNPEIRRNITTRDITPVPQQVPGGATYVSNYENRAEKTETVVQS